MENNNANAQQPSTTQQPLVVPKEPGFCEPTWEATKVVAAVSASSFRIEFAKAAGITLGACLVLKAFGVFDGKSDNA